MDIVNYLKSTGPQSSSKIASILEDEGVKSDAARKRIQRLQDQVKKLDQIKLPHNATFLYLDEHLKTEQFQTNLIDVLVETNSSYVYPILSLGARGGLIPKYLIPTFTGSPKTIKGHLSYSIILDSLINIGLLRKLNDDKLGDYITLAPNSPIRLSSPKEILAVLKAEQLLIEHLRKWFARLGFLSWNSVQIRNNGTLPEFGSFNWDLTGPSYVHPFRALGRNTPGFIVADVILNKSLDKRDIQYFISKTTILRNNKNIRPFMSVLIADGFERDAFALRGETGIVLTTPEILFGKDIAESLGLLIEILTNTANVILHSPEKLDRLLGGLLKMGGELNNLKGELFNILIGYLMTKEKGSSLYRVGNDY